MISFHYKEHMHWLNLVQLLRKTIVDIKAELCVLTAEKKTTVESGDHFVGNYLRLIARIGKDLDMLEEAILQELNNGQLHWYAKRSAPSINLRAGRLTELCDRVKAQVLAVFALEREIGGLLCAHQSAAAEAIQKTA